MRSAISITIAAGLVRIIIGGLTPLFPDETYYWEWSRRLAAGYFDHPPAIAWLIRAGTLAAGDTPLGVRLGPGVAGIVAGLFLCGAARRIAGDRAALVTAVVFAIMPLSAAGLILATPDAPLLATAAATCWAVLRALEHPPRSLRSFGWWCAAGLTVGLGLLSKYTAVLLPFGVFVAFLVYREWRPRLADPGPYVATAIAIAIFSPVVLWNASHDWASFGFQLRHGLGGTGGSVINRELELIGGQLALVSPILFALMIAAAYRRDLQPPAANLLPAVAATIFVFFMYSATKRRVEANWPALAYVPGVLLLAARPRTRRWDSWLGAGVGVAALLTLTTYINSFTPALPVPARRDPVARSMGWDDMARAVNRVYAPRLSISAYRTHVGADRYQEASQLAFHLPNHPESYALNLTTRSNQYDLWPGFEQRAQSRDGLILVLDDVTGEHSTITALKSHFTAVTRGEQVVLARNGDPIKVLRVWILDGWLGSWPK